MHIYLYHSSRPHLGYFRVIKPYAVDFFQTIFHSFKAGIANAISSSK